MLFSHTADTENDNVDIRVLWSGIRGQNEHEVSSSGILAMLAMLSSLCRSNAWHAQLLIVTGQLQDLHKQNGWSPAGFAGLFQVP